jgi:hypothetical protein
MGWRSWWSRLQQLPAPVVDVGLALTLVAAVTAAITYGPPQGKSPDAVA